MSLRSEHDVVALAMHQEYHKNQATVLGSYTDGNPIPDTTPNTGTWSVIYTQNIRRELPNAPEPASITPEPPADLNN